MQQFILEFNPRDKRQLLAYVMARAMLYQWNDEEIREQFFDSSCSWEAAFNTDFPCLCSRNEKEAEHLAMERFVNKHYDAYADLYPNPSLIPNPKKKR